MKKFFQRAGALFLALCLSINGQSLLAQVNAKPFVVPELTTWAGAEGEFTPSGRIVVKGNKDVLNVAKAFAADYKEMFGQELSVVKGGKAQKGDFLFAALKKDKRLGKEGYRLTIGDVVVVEAATTKGAFWATRTLLQLSEQDAERQLPAGATTDVPQYELRGFIIDVGRKFIPMSYLRNLSKTMAYYKMNTLQVHLNDNGFKQYFGDDWGKTPAAFRLESTTYPELTAKDGSYTKQEFIDLQKLAETNFVEIIPEIDAPAHALAFTRFMPEIGSTKYGMDHLDIFNPKTYEFLDGLYKEYLSGDEPVFRGKRVHVGTDEFSNATEELREKFRSFTDHYLRLVEGYGKQPVCWGALSHAYGKTPVKSENVIMYCWYNGYANPTEMKKQGYKLVSIPDGWVYIVPAAGYYYDYLNCENLYKNWTPATIGNQKFEENDPAILGGMFAVWNDHAGNGISTKDIHHRVMPALHTLSVKCWTGKETTLDYATFDKQRQLLSEAPGVNELGRHGIEPACVLQQAVVTPGATLPIEEIGYDYSVSFDVEGVEESKGTELFRSSNAVVYLSDPNSGRLAFERDGYLNCFNYRIEKGKKVRITIQGNNKMTRLLVNGKKREELGSKTLYVIRESNRHNYHVNEAKLYQPEVYDTGDKMHYQRTLVFPLQKAGQFKSKIANLEVENFIK